MYRGRASHVEEERAAPAAEDTVQISSIRPTMDFPS